MTRAETPSPDTISEEIVSTPQQDVSVEPPRDPAVQEAVKRLLDSGKTVQDIADLTGASVRTVYRWLDGEGALPVFRRALLALHPAS